MDTHKEWFKNVTSGDSVNAAAQRSGLQQATLNRQLHRGVLPAESVISISRGYGCNPIRGLVQTGYITQREAEVVIKVLDWTEASDLDLAAEILRRAQNSEVLNRPIDSALLE